MPLGTPAKQARVRDFFVDWESDEPNVDAMVQLFINADVSPSKFMSAARAAAANRSEHSFSRLQERITNALYQDLTEADEELMEDLTNYYIIKVVPRDQLSGSISVPSPSSAPTSPLDPMSIEIQETWMSRLHELEEGLRQQQ